MRNAMVLSSLALAAAALGQVYNLNANWSEAANPNGVWSLLEDVNLLPHVAGWQSGGLGGWAFPQPGWARSENGADRLPFFFKSNGSETFVHDFVQGDVVCHSWDATNGVGNGHGSAVWTSPARGAVRVTGAVWMGRDIGRAVDWAIRLNGARRTGGSLASGDPYSRAIPFNLANGDAGPGSLRGILVQQGDKVALRLDTASVFGDFVGIDLTVRLDPISCFGDANGDNVVNFTDLNFVLSNFGQTGQGILGDLNFDDAVDFFDLNLVLSEFGHSCPAT